MNMIRSENLPCPRKNFVSIHKGDGCLIMNTQRIRLTIRFTMYFNSWIKLLCNWKKEVVIQLVAWELDNLISLGLITFQEAPGAVSHSISQKWSLFCRTELCLMPLLQEAVISCVREDEMGTEGCYSRSECGNTASHSFLLLINLKICHLLQYRLKEQTGFCWEDNSKQTRKLGRKESDLEKVMHRCFQELMHPRGNSHQKNRAGQQRVPLCHCATGVSLGGNGFPPRSSR